MVSVWAFELKLRGSKSPFVLVVVFFFNRLPPKQSISLSASPPPPSPLLTSHLACKLNVPTRTFADLLLLKALQSTVIHVQKSREALATTSTPPCPYLSTPIWQCLPHLLQTLPREWGPLHYSIDRVTIPISKHYQSLKIPSAPSLLYILELGGHHCHALRETVH